MVKASQLFTGIALGALTGAATVLLSTPKTGEEVRHSIKAKSADYQEKLADIKKELHNVKVSIKSLTAESKSVVPATVNDIKASVETWKEEAGPLQEHLQEEIASIQSAITELEQQLPKKNKKEAETL